MHHTAVTERTWHEIQQFRQNLPFLETEPTKRQAYYKFNSTKRFFTDGYSCTKWNSTCKPEIVESPHPNPQGQYDTYIKCINTSQDINGHHTSQPIRRDGNIDIPFLKRLFNHEIRTEFEECGAIEHTAQTSRFCHFNHTQGVGRLTVTKCSVKYHWMIPVDLQTCPFYIFTSFGIHTHPPPPPSKAPVAIMEGIFKVIQEMREPSLTLSK
ncbi:hypothetical protein BDV26DRAFT_222318 [Aspergillus bertholletiae]|uniref:Uncharacterized protein n=1 Tax=Aspergillus bertholletiae TaxID=1226010 RepID=A0A5N7B4Z5_9EURO|nr:hypothetical protein BDV26DRAFT_222318 [Aspergillus bertholletiae]